MQLGNPGEQTYKILLCKSLDKLAPLAFDGRDTDCWLRCAPADILSPAAVAWLVQQLNAAVARFSSFVSLAWCARSAGQLHARLACSGARAGMPRSSGIAHLLIVSL